MTAPQLSAPKSKVLLGRPRWIRWVGFAVAAVLVAALGFVGVEAYRLGHNILVTNTGDQSAAFNLSAKSTSPDWSQFKNPGDGRVNILVLGIGGVTDAGQAHAGTYLTDSIQLLSLDTLNHTVALTSIPRDFEVKTPDGYGYEKINAVYEGSDGSTKNGGDRAKTTVGTLLGTHITNYMVVDFTAAKQLVDAVGGIDITAPTAIDDPTYPAADDVHYDPFHLSAGPHHLDGATALKYMRTRHDDSDFARSGRQQAVFTAVQQKALSLGVLGNPSKVNQIVSALGSHVKTDLTVTEISELVSNLKQVTPSGITSNVLDTSEKLGLLVSNSDPDLGYVEQPAAGLTNYTAIHNWFQSNTIDPLITKERAVIQLHNVGASAKSFAAEVAQLQAYGFTASAAGEDTATPSSATATPTQTTIRVRSRATKPVTVNYLVSLLGATVVTDSTLPTGVDMVIDYVPAKPTAAKTTTPGSAAPSSTSSSSVSSSSAWSIE